MWTLTRGTAAGFDHWTVKSHFPARVSNAVGGQILLCYVSFRNVCLDTKNCGGGDWMSQSKWGNVQRSAFSHSAKPCRVADG